MGTGMPGDGGGLAWHAARDCVLSGDEQGTDRRSLKRFWQESRKSIASCLFIWYTSFIRILKGVHLLFSIRQFAGLFNHYFKYADYEILNIEDFVIRHQ